MRGEVVVEKLLCVSSVDSLNGSRARAKLPRLVVAFGNNANVAVARFVNHEGLRPLRVDGYHAIGWEGRSGVHCKASQIWRSRG